MNFYITNSRRNNFQKYQLLKDIEKNKKKINYISRFVPPFKIDDNYTSVIPLKIYTCWHTKHLLPGMKQNFESLISDNPEFEVFLFDNNDCENFIKDNFNNEVLNAYKRLIPEAYKSDLWRYCVMYINGGIYLDIKFRCINGFKLIALTEKERWTSDHLFNDTLNGLLILKPKNDIMLKCINKVVENVKNKFYGENCLHPTGPKMLGQYFTNEEKREMETNLLVTPKLIGITYQNRYILKFYSEYRNEQEQEKQKPHYSILWANKNIYL